MLTGPLYMLQVYDRVLSSRSESTLVALTVLIAALYGIMGVLDYARGRIAAREAASLIKLLGSLGSTAAEAFHYMYAMEQACRIQVLAQSTGADLITVPTPIVDRIMEQVKVVVRGEGSAIIWPGLLRKLDRVDPSFRE